MPIQYPTQNIYQGLHFPVTPLVTPQQREAQEALTDSRNALAEERRQKLKKLRDDAIEEATITKALQSLPTDATTGQPDYDQLPNLVLQVGGNLNHIKTAQKFVDDTNKARLDQFKTQNAIEKDEVALSVQALQQTNEDGSNWPPVRRQALASISDPKKRAMMEEVVPVEFPGMDGVRTLVQHGESAHDFAARTDALMKEAPLTVEAWKKFLGETISAPGVPPATIEAAKNLARTYGGKIGKDAAAMMEGVTPEAAAGMAITPEQRAQMAEKQADNLRQAATQARIAGHEQVTEELARANLRVAQGHLAISQKAETRQEKAQQAQFSDEALNQAADKYFTTGQLPPMGMGGMAQRVAVMNRAAERHPGAVLAANSAEYKANAATLSVLTKQLNAVEAFENTGLKNLDMFTDLAAKIPDTGIPWLNTPVRQLSQSVVGSSNMAAVNAARQVALTEISRVVNNPNLTGILSDSARKEVADLIPANATFNQIKRVATVLKQDMANRKQGLATQVNDITQRLGGKPSQGTTPSSKPADYVYDPATGTLKKKGG